jgi:hypothetical protein
MCSVDFKHTAKQCSASLTARIMQVSHTIFHVAPAAAAPAPGPPASPAGGLSAAMRSRSATRPSFVRLSGLVQALRPMCFRQQFRSYTACRTSQGCVAHAWLYVRQGVSRDTACHAPSPAVHLPADCAIMKTVCKAEAVCTWQDQQRGAVDGPRGPRAQAVLHAGVHAARLRHERGARGAPNQRAQPQRSAQATGGGLMARA